MRLMAVGRGGASVARLGRYALWALLVLAIAYWTVAAAFSVAIVPEPTGFSDFAMYFAAAQGLRAGVGPSVYSPDALMRIAVAHGRCTSAPVIAYVYPPLLALALEPLTLLSCTAAAQLWHLLNAALWVAATLLLASHLRRRWPGQRLLATVLVVLASGCSWLLLFNLWIGQVVFVVLFCLVLAAWLVEHDHPFWAGMVLAVAALIKILPAVVIGYYLLRGRWRVVGGALAAFVALTALMVALAGIPTVVTGVWTVLTSGVHEAQPPGDDAISVMFPGVGAAVSLLGGLLFLVVAFWTRGRGDEWLGFAWAICTMLLVSPLVWWLYLPWLLPAFAACLSAVRSRGWLLVLVLVALAVPLVIRLDPVPRSLSIVAWWLVTGLLFVRSAWPLRWDAFTPRLRGRSSAQPPALASARQSP